MITRDVWPLIAILITISVFLVSFLGVAPTLTPHTDDHSHANSAEDHTHEHGDVHVDDPAKNVDEVFGGHSRDHTTYWGNFRPYTANDPHRFGVAKVGVPKSCQIEQVHILHRHGSRYPTGGTLDGANFERFADKLSNVQSKNEGKFTGPLEYLNRWKLQLGTDLLLPLGASQLQASGAATWTRYGGILFGREVGEPYPGSSIPSKIFHRTTSQSRIWESSLNWMFGFYGPRQNQTGSLLSIPEADGQNNTLASYHSCPASKLPLFDRGRPLATNWINEYMTVSKNKLLEFVPPGFNLTQMDVYALQKLCVFESQAFGSSQACLLFTSDDWEGFEFASDIKFNGDSLFGCPVGRALGIGYLEELLARLERRVISSSESSINSTLSSHENTFPLDRKL